MGRFDGSVVIVSGGARGLGAAYVRAFAGEGATVVSGDVLDEEGRASAAEIGTAVRYVHLDVTSSAEWDAAVAVAESLGPVKVLVNNAGIVVDSPILARDEKAFRRVLDINTTGVWLGMASVAPAMIRAGGGSIVNISSLAGLRGHANISSYVASKWAVRGMTKGAALELGRSGIRVNSVHPGQIESPMTSGRQSSMTLSQPIARRGVPAEVVSAVLFFASAEASYITGSELAVDGGSLLGPLEPIGDGHVPSPGVL